MKFLGYILAFLVIALSCFPCSDAASVTDVVKVQVASTQQPGDHHADACTPFCLCSCCAASSIISKLPVNTPAPAASQQSFSSYLQQPLYKLAHAVWQPPQLV